MKQPDLKNIRLAHDAVSKSVNNLARRTVILPDRSARLSAQAIGTYGEKAAEAELIRHGWVTANINTSIKNAADFDIFAHKGTSAVNVRVKACGPGVDAFAFGFRRGQPIKFDNLGKADFSVLVGMGKKRTEDVFYVVPTRIVRKLIDARRTYYLRQKGRDGGPRKDLGWWTLHLPDLKRSKPQPGYGLARNWRRYLDNWAALEGGHVNNESG